MCQVLDIHHHFSLLVYILNNAIELLLYHILSSLTHGNQICFSTDLNVAFHPYQNYIYGLCVVAHICSLSTCEAEAEDYKFKVASPGCIAIYSPTWAMRPCPKIKNRKKFFLCIWMWMDTYEFITIAVLQYEYVPFHLKLKSLCLFFKISDTYRIYVKWTYYWSLTFGCCACWAGTVA